MNLFTHYGEERERIATEDELEIFDHLCQMSGRDDIRLVRKSDNYVTAVIKDWDLARFKYTPRAKWIMFPVMERGSEKHRIDSPSDVEDYLDMLKDSISHIEHYI
jgi:hypothetical protein